MAQKAPAVSGSGIRHQKKLQDAVNKLGEKIPPKRVLVEQSQVTRVTIRQPLRNIEPKGSAKRGHRCRYQDQPKAIDLCPLERRFSRLLGDDEA